MKHQFLSVALALCLCFSPQSAMSMPQSSFSLLDDASTEDSQPASDSTQNSIPSRDDSSADGSQDDSAKDDSSVDDSQDDSNPDDSSVDGSQDDSAKDDSSVDGSQDDSAKDNSSVDGSQDDSNPNDSSVDGSQDDSTLDDSSADGSQDDSTLDDSSVDGSQADDQTQDDFSELASNLTQDNLSTEESISEPIAYAESAPSDNVIPTPTEAYSAMIAYKDKEGYTEGTTWTDYEPYSDSTGYYRWKGGPLGGTNISAVGCVAFAFTLSDAAFGNLPARMYASGDFTYDDIKVGDILRVSNDTHTVIVLEVSEAGVVVAEGNYNSSVHWGRTISKDEVMSNTDHYITRYPEGYVAPDDSTANDIIANGTLSTGLPWTLTKAGTLTVSGSGAIPDFSSIEEQPWSANSSQIRKVVIGEGVTSIGSCAFWNCGVLSAEIASSVTAIGNSAFRGSSIISVTIPSSVKTIGDSAFRECRGLTSVTVSEGVETIDQNAFRACTSLESIALPASIGEVGAGAFFQCTAMKSAAFAPGSKQVKMGDNLFSQCYWLMSVQLPESIDRVSEGMFQNCGMLAGAIIPQGAESIGGSAFASCSGFTTVVIPDSVTTIGIAAFANCPLTDIYFTGTEAQWNGISKIGDTAAAVAKATIHYEYSPEPTTAPTEAPEPTVAPTADPGQTASPEPTANPGQTASPEPTAAPGQTASPEPTAAPGQTASPEPTAAPGQTASPVPTAAPTSAPKPTTAPTPTAKPTTAPTPAPTAPPSATIQSGGSGSGQEGWAAIQEETGKASDGNRIHINMNGTSVVPGSVLDSVKGRDVTLSFDMGNGIVWLVNGRNVTADHANDVNLSVQIGTTAIPRDIVSNVAGDRSTVQLSLAHSGDFGYGAVLVINMGTANAKSYANLFYYNESTGGLEFVTVDQINENGIAELLFTHASNYVIVVGEAMGKSAGAAGVKSPKTGEFNPVIGETGEVGLQSEGSGMDIIWLLVIGAAGMAAMGALAYLVQKKAAKSAK